MQGPKDCSLTPEEQKMEAKAETNGDHSHQLGLGECCELPQQGLVQSPEHLKGFLYFQQPSPNTITAQRIPLRPQCTACTAMPLWRGVQADGLHAFR